MISIILLFIALLAIALICVIILRHWKEIRLLNPESITEERERSKRDELLRQRFERVKTQKLVPLFALGARILVEARHGYRALYDKLIQLEKFYKQAKSPFAAMAPSTKERVSVLLADAQSLARELRFADAERRYIEALGMDARNAVAFKGLGMIYLTQKFIPQAKETFEFLVKTKKADDVCYAALAEIAETEGDFTKAEEMRNRSVGANPRLAIRHAELAEFYLARGNVEQAKIPAETCARLDPDSARCLEVFVEAAILSGDRNEAKQSYDKLRLLSEDHSRLQSLKERMDAMKGS